MTEGEMIYSFFRNRSLREKNRVAIVDYDTGKEVTYGELALRADKLAGFFKDTLHLKKGDVVAHFARNGSWSLELLYAMPVNGTILATYNCMLKAEELEALIRLEAPKIMFYENVYIDKITYFHTKFPEIIFIPLDGERSIDPYTYADIMQGKPFDGQWEEMQTEDILMLLHTGGTTGLPKAAMISYRAELLNTIAQIADYSIENQDIAYVLFPFFHTASWNSALPILQVGGQVILKKKFDAPTTLRMVDEKKLTILAGSPTVFRRLSLCKEFEKCSFRTVRAVRCGSATPTRELMELYWAKGSRLNFYNGYGMTEAGSGTLSLPAAAMSRSLCAKKAGTVGMPMMFTKVRIIDENGEDVERGEKGELLVDNGIMFSGYYKHEEETAKVLKDGWLHTGDIAYCDADGFYFICGRKKNMYISGGENIYPSEIETFILNHPAVMDAYVFGVPDANWGEVGKALVVIREGAELTKEELIVYLRKHISTIKIPRYIQFVSQIPRNDAGKIIGKIIDDVYKFAGDAP